MKPHDPIEAFDARARAVHAHALDALSPRVHAQLAQRRHAALRGVGTAPARRGLLPWAGMATAGLALAFALQLRPPGATPADPVPAGAGLARGAMPGADVATATLAAADSDTIAPDLAEDPDFYLWLGAGRPSTVE